MGTRPRQFPAAKQGLGKWLQARCKARRDRGKAPPGTGVPPFLSEVLGCQESRQGTTRRLAADTPGLGRCGSWPWLSAEGTAAVGSCWSGRLREGQSRGRLGRLGGVDRRGGTRLLVRVPAEPPPSRAPSPQDSFERDGVTVI